MIQTAHEDWARQGDRELLLDCVRRLETERSRRHAVQVALSHLPPSYGRPHHIRAAKAGIASLAELSHGQLFTLENLDLILVHEAEAQGHVETEIGTLKKLLGVSTPFNNDRIGHALETWFDLATCYDAFVALVQSASDTDDAMSDAHREPISANPGSSPVAGNEGVASTRETVGRLSKALQNADLSNLLRRQAVYALGRQMYPQPLFR